MGNFRFGAHLTRQNMGIFDRARFIWPKQWSRRPNEYRVGIHIRPQSSLRNLNILHVRLCKKSSASGRHVTSSAVALAF